MIYVTVQGDTFDSIAKEHFGNEFRMDQLIEANPKLCDTVIFDAGIRMVILELSEELPEDDSMPPWRINP